MHLQLQIANELLPRLETDEWPTVLVRGGDVDNDDPFFLALKIRLLGRVWPAG